MKLREFVDTYDKEFEEPERKGVKGNDEKAIPNEGVDEKGNPVRGPVKVDKDTCAFCHKKIFKGDKWFGDKMGNVYHQECYDEKFGNEDKEKYGSEYPENETKEEEKTAESAERKPKKMTERKKTMAKAKEPKKETKKSPKPATATKKGK